MADLAELQDEESSLRSPSVDGIVLGHTRWASIGIISQPNAHPQCSDEATAAVYNPAGLAQPTGYTHVVAARGQRLVYISGQIAFDAAGQLVGPGDLRAQAVQVYENLKTALAAAGATFADVVKLNTYVVNFKPEFRPLLAEVRGQFIAGQPPASTLVGVSALALDGLLIEIEAVAVTG